MFLLFINIFFNGNQHFTHMPGNHFIISGHQKVSLRKTFFHPLNVVFIQCGAYLRVAFIYKLERIVSFKLPV